MAWLDRIIDHGASTSTSGSTASAACSAREAFQLVCCLDVRPLPRNAGPAFEPLKVHRHKPALQTISEWMPGHLG